MRSSLARVGPAPQRLPAPRPSAGASAASGAADRPGLGARGPPAHPRGLAPTHGPRPPGLPRREHDRRPREPPLPGRRP